MGLLTLTNAEIINGFPVLADHREKVNTGTINSCIVKALKNLDVEDVESSYICFLNGDNQGLDRIILSYDDTTGEFTFDDTNVIVDNKSMIAIISNDYITYSERAETILKQDLKNQGANFDLFFNANIDLKEVHLLGTLKNICFSLRRDTNADDIYHSSYLDFKDQYDTNLARLVADYDFDEDGILDPEEEDYKVGQIVLGK